MNPMRIGNVTARLLLTTAALAAAALLSVEGAAPAASWPQWGGPDRNFKVDASGLAENWPAEGPRRLWNRPLGEGYSAISAVDGRLFTMVRRGQQEVAVALDAATGETLWEYAYAAPFSDEYSMENGPGPHAEPLVVGGRVFTTGATGILHAFDIRTGKVLWSHNLLAEYNGTLRVNGYACSPIAHGDMVIVMVGGEGHAVMAFRQADGSVVWQSQDFHNSASSPLLINVDGQDQLIAFLYAEIVAVAPRDGKLLWSHPHKTDYGLNVSMPVWGDGNLLFFSSTYGGGSRVLRLTQAGGKTKVEEVWAHNLMRVHFTNVVRIGDVVYGSSGDFGPVPLTALNVKTGQVVWRHRGLARATLVAAGKRLIALDEDGVLMLATPTAEGLQIHSQAALLTGNAWTTPTLVGSTLYLRDRKNIFALDLSE